MKIQKERIKNLWRKNLKIVMNPMNKQKIIKIKIKLFKIKIFKINKIFKIKIMIFNN